MRLEVEIESQTILDEREEGRYGSWRKVVYNRFKGVYAIKPDCYVGEPVDFEFNIGDPVFVVWVEYSDGNSFGRKDGCYDVISIFKDVEKAKKLCDILEDADNKEQATITFITEGGAEISYYCPFIGHFERLIAVNLEGALIRKKYKP